MQDRSGNEDASVAGWARGDLGSAFAPGAVIAGKYRVDHLLGAGGMGAVVAATQLELEHRVAIKFVRPEALNNPESVERFLREARAAVRLRSEHVARVYDVGRLDTGEPFMVMEFLEGSDLGRMLATRGAPTMAESVEYVVQACEALVEAHACGIIHRDLKPQNLFVTRRMNGSPLVKLLDFGISKAMGPAGIGQLSLTSSTVVLGSPLYMSPETMRSARNADVRSDVWALGVILYQLLCGRVPFDAETVTELCLKVVNDPVPPIRGLHEEVPNELAALVARCLEKDPAKRFQSVAELAASLEPWAASAHRGSIRAWHSLAETAETESVLVDHRESSSATPSHATTQTTWQREREAAQATVRRPRAAARWLVATVAAALLVAAAFYMRLSPSESAPGIATLHAARLTPETPGRTLSAAPVLVASQGDEAHTVRRAVARSPSKVTVVPAEEPETDPRREEAPLPQPIPGTHAAPSMPGANGAPILR